MPWPEPPASGRPKSDVGFTFSQQETKRTRVVALSEVPDDEGAAERDGCCELCGRQLKLTFHHLVPKETHGRYLGKGLQPEPTREFLNTYGAELCRFCHSTVHRLAPNAVLAERFNSVACLCAQPELMKFAEFAKRQRGTARVTK